MRIRHLLAALAALTLSATLVQPVMADKHHKNQNYQHQNYKHQNYKHQSYQHDYKHSRRTMGIAMGSRSTSTRTRSNQFRLWIASEALTTWNLRY
jgi:lipopolysaccharide export system protein LptC